MAAFDYDCPSIVNDLIAETGRYMNEVAMKAIPTTPWLVNTPRGAWPTGMGKVLNSIIFERTVPTTNGTEWTDSVFSDGADNAGCDYTPETIEFGQTPRSFQRQNRYIQTNDFCIEDLMDDFQVQSFLRGMARNMRGVSSYVWADFHRRSYSDLSEHKLTANAGWDITATSFDGSNPPTSVLKAGHLEDIANWLQLEGYFGDSSIGISSTGRQILTLITSANTSRNLIRLDPLLREDFRYSYMGYGDRSPLMMAYGQGISYNGFKHVIDLPRRFDIETNAYVERYPYKTPEAATKGKKQNIDPLYLAAEYEESYIHVPSVFRELIPAPRGDLGSGFSFDPQNYMGDFQFQVIRDRQCNPRGNKGYFDALFSAAAEPGDTWLGFAIRHRTYPPDVRPITQCYS